MEPTKRKGLWRCVVRLRFATHPIVYDLSILVIYYSLLPDYFSLLAFGQILYLNHWRRRVYFTLVLCKLWCLKRKLYRFKGSCVMRQPRWKMSKLVTTYSAHLLFAMKTSWAANFKVNCPCFWWEDVLTLTLTVTHLDGNILVVLEGKPSQGFQWPSTSNFYEHGFYTASVVLSPLGIEPEVTHYFWCRVSFQYKHQFVELPEAECNLHHKQIRYPKKNGFLLWP